MPLDKITLTAALKEAFGVNEPGLTGDAKSNIEQMSEEIADAIDVFVKSGTVVTTVAVTSVSGVTPGPGVSGPGAGTGTGNVI
jgi:hypothetical protein